MKAAIFHSIALLVLLAGCGATTYTDGVPNLVQVGPGVWRSGQPTTPAAWAALKKRGVTTVVKLNYDAEGSDDGARALGMTVIELSINPEDDHPISVVEPPDHTKVDTAVFWMERGNVLVHCTHGHDRTGYVVGRYRVLHDGWTKEAAWNEMVKRGFHPELVGLVAAWLEFQPH